MGCDGERLIMAAFPFLGKILDIPIYCTTQNAARLGATVSELRGNFPPDTKEVDKTAFSMVRFLAAPLSSLTCYSSVPERSLRTDNTVYYVSSSPK